MGSSNDENSSEASSLGIPGRWEDEELGQAAFERFLPEMLDLPESKVMTVNLNVTQSIATAFGALERVRAHREDLVKACANCRFHWVDALEDCALALNYARAEYLTVTRPSRCSPEVWAEARRVRRALMHQWRGAAERTHVNDSLSLALQRGKGYLEMGADLTILAHALRAHSAGKGVEPSPEVQRAEALSKLILTAGGRPNARSEALVRARNVQNRAFTLFVRSFNETRLSMAYARRDERDFDDIIPSLYSARRSQSSRSKRRAGTTDEVAESSAVTESSAGANAGVITSAQLSPTSTRTSAIAPVATCTPLGVNAESSAEVDRAKPRDSDAPVRPPVSPGGPFEDDARSGAMKRSARAR